MRHRPVCGVPAPKEVDPLVGQSMVRRPGDDAIQITGSRRPGLNPVVDVDPWSRWAKGCVNSQPVTAITVRDTLCAVQVRQITVGQGPQHSVDCASGEWLKRCHPALVDQPVIVG